MSVGLAYAKGMEAAGLLLVLAITACGQRPSKVEGAPNVPPSESYRLSSGYQEGFLWHCFEGARVHMFRSCEPGGCAKWSIARGPCGKPMPDEPPPFSRTPMTGAGWW